MDQVLGVDLGTTYTAAAATPVGGGKPEMIGLGNRTAEIPSVLLFRSDGEFLVGEPAERRAFGEPDRVARQFKRRLGDATPLLLGGSPFSPEALLGRLLKYVVARAVEQRGAEFAATVVCHPANFGPYRMELLGQAAKMAEVDDVHFVPEPVAAAVHYSDQATLDSGENVVVYDFGGGTFDVAVLRRTADGFEIIGTPAGLEHLGGLDLDEAVFGHVAQSVGASLTELDPGDPAVVAAVVRLRDECKSAKEALSSDTDTSIPVLLPGIQTEVRLTRAEFEGMILPSVIDTVATTTRAIREAGLEPADVGRILLVGGSARVPLVSQLLSEELGRPIVVDAHPKHAIALGAARWGALEVEHGSHGASAAEAPMVAAAVAAVETDAVAPVDEPLVENPATVPTPIVEEVVAEEPPPPPAPVVEPDPAPRIQTRPEPASAPVAEVAAPAPQPYTPPKESKVGAIVRGALLVGFVAILAVGFTLIKGEHGSKPHVVAVLGLKPWTDTGVDLKVGDKVNIVAFGRAAHAPGEFTGPDGDPNPGLDQYSLMRSAPHNALIGKIGKTAEFFLVGNSSTFQADSAGRLFLGPNDTGTQNNSGSYTATITVQHK
jgi:actin-like ATPase involved in cell morphogenesis